MTTAKRNAASMTVQRGEETPANELNAQTGSTESQEPTAEELKKVIEDLNRKLSAIPQDLDKRIEYFNHKKELIRRLSILNADSEVLNSHLIALSQIAAANEFENEEYFLNIEGGNKYSKKAIYSLKNPMIIGELLVFIIGRIDSKREEIRKEIEA